MFIATGCSHTRSKEVSPENRWIQKVFDSTGKLFKFREFSRQGIGLCNIFTRLIGLDPKNVQYLLIQKPQPIRFPWWIDDWREDMGWSRYGGYVAIEARTRSKIKFKRSLTKKKKEIARLIYNQELKMLSGLRSHFCDTNIAYYHYWADYIIDVLHFPELSHINTELGIEAEKMGIENWDTIIDIEKIPGALSKDGSIEMDMKLLYDLEWIWQPDDLHPSNSFHSVVAKKAITWIS